MTYALPAAAPPPPRRQVLVGTALASLAVLMMVGSMVGVWILQRKRALDAGNPWVPQGVAIPEVPTNVMLVSFGALLVFAQWAVYAVRRRDRQHLGLALSLVVVVALAILNAQVYVYTRMGVGIGDTGYGGMFYALTGAIVALIVIGLVFTGITVFRVLGGRDSDREIVAAHALYWYVVSIAFAAVWLIVYVTK